MDRQFYLYLITDTYFNTKNPVASEAAEPMFDLQIKLFREILVRKQKVAEREDFVTKDEFLLQCALALDHIKEYMGMQISIETSRLHDERESIRTFWFDESGSVQDMPKSVVEDDMLRAQNKIDDFDENNFLVDLSALGGIIKGKICNYDVMLIEEVFEIFNVETDQSQQTEPRQLHLSDTSVVENKIKVIKEPYGEMFAKNGFQLFEHILGEYIKPKNTTGRYEDLSFHYRCLFEDKFIHQKPEPFRLWFIEKYKEEFTKIKTKIQTTNPQRKKDYSTALDWFNLQNQ